LSVHIKSNALDEFIWTWGGDCIIREDVCGEFKKDGITGFMVKPVVIKKRGIVIGDIKYYELITIGWAGMAKRESGISIREECRACRYRMYSGVDKPAEIIDIGQWDGSDVFMVWPLPRYRFITEKVVSIMEVKRYRGARVANIGELRMKRGETLTPGRLGNYMPHERAERLGGPLGIV
jgi:hypothetical protein